MERPEFQPRPEISIDAAKALAAEGLVADVDWVFSQMPEVKAAQVADIKSTAYRVRSSQLFAEAGRYDRMYGLSDNIEWQRRMIDQSDALRAQGRTFIEEANRLIEINREGFTADILAQTEASDNL